MSQFKRLAMENIVKANGHAADGRHHKARKHMRVAVNHFKSHMSHMKKQKASQVDMDKEQAEFDNHMDGIERRMAPKDDTQKSDTAKCDTKKMCKKCGKMEKGCDCGYMNKKKSLKKAQEKVLVGSPKADERYDYAHLKDLHPEDRKAAERKFGIKDLGHYKYPVDKVEGRLVHATRVKHDEPVPPVAEMSHMLPEHKEGSAVRIHSGDHAGTFGVVGNPSPYHPNKLTVQTGPGSHEKVYVPHTHVEPAKGTVAKAVTTLFDIRQRLGG